jgi:hypothetical protein
MATRDELVAAATEIHDREGCACDRRYLMSCTRLAAAVLRAGAEMRDREAIDR